MNTKDMVDFATLVATLAVRLGLPPYSAAVAANEMRALSVRLHRLAVRACNDPMWGEDDDKRVLSYERRALHMVEQIDKGRGICRAAFGRDPRGACFWIEVKDGEVTREMFF